MEIFIILSLKYNFHRTILSLFLIAALIPHFILTLSKKVRKAQSVGLLLKYYQQLLLFPHHEFLKKFCKMDIAMLLQMGITIHYKNVVSSCSKIKNRYDRMGQILLQNGTCISKWDKLLQIRVQRHEWWYTLFDKHTYSFWTHDVKWTYIRLSEDVLDIFWTLYIRS